MLRQLMLIKKIEQRKTGLTDILAKMQDINVRSTALEKAIEEAETEEEIAVVEGEAETIEKEKEILESEKSKLEGEIAELEGELEGLDSKNPSSEARKNEKQINERNERGEETYMKRQKFFGGLTREGAESFIKREDVKDFIERTRSLMQEKRGVTGAELTIPEVMLDLLRDNLHEYSKLIKRVNLRPVKGQMRQNIAGTIPEAIWTEACANLNALNIVFNQVEVDGYKVGGYIAICNATLADSDLNLANEILTTLSQSIGLAVDKAILYGTGTKMPVGIVKRLAETAKPNYWGTNEPAWTDLHTKNLMVIDPAATTDILFYKDLILKLGKAKANYSNGTKFWTMSSNTFATLQAKALTINAAGAIVSGQNNTMPIVGGDIEFLDFIPDGHIIGGYGSLYILAEREGAQLAQSEHVQFLADNTVYKGTARYDGRPIFGEGFVAININQEGVVAAPAPSDVTFASDTAN